MLAAPLLNEVRSVSKRRGLSGALLFAMTIGGPVPCDAAQEPYPLELTWDAPQSCPQLDEVEEQIRTLVSGLTDGHWQSSMRARGTIVGSGPRFELTLVIQQGQSSGRRVIASDDCDSLGKAAAVVLGLLIRKERLGRDLSEREISGETEQPTQSGAAASAAASPAPSVRPEPPQAKQSSPLAVSTTTPTEISSLILVAPNLVLDVGTLPGTGYGAGLGAGIAAERWRVFVTGNQWLSQSTRPFAEQLFQATFRRRSADVTGCFVWSLHRVFDAGPCAQFAVDLLSAEASGGRLLSNSETSVLFSVGAGLGAFWHFTPSTAIAFTAMGRLATRRPTFVLETPFGADGVYTVPSVSAGASLGLVWIF